MRKIFFAAIAVVCVAFIGCTKDDNQIVNNDDVNFIFSVSEKPSLDEVTRVVKTEWENNDQILIVFKSDDPNTVIGKNTVLLTYNGSAWTAEASTDFDASSLDNENKEFSAHYHRGGIGFLSTIIATNYKGGELYYVVNCEYTVDGSNFNLGTIDMQLYEDDETFQVSIPGLDPFYNWDLGITDQSGNDVAWYLGGFSMKISSINGYWADGQASQIASNGVQVGDEHVFWFQLKENSATEYKFKLHSGGGHNLTYTVTKDDDHTLSAKKAYKLPDITEEGKWLE
jgi:hypothetical protein